MPYLGNTAGNRLVFDDVDATEVAKIFFVERTDMNTNVSGTTPYDGTPNFGAVNSVRTAKMQHVVVLETTDEMSPNRGNVSRGVDQKYRVRFEYDERPRLYAQDTEFEEELYQLNIKLKELGTTLYEFNNSPDDSILGADNPGHPGFTLTGSTQLTTGWQNTIGIPNPMYTWLKMSVATKNQIFPDGTTSDNMGFSDGLITLNTGAVISTAVSRKPGEVTDMHFEDVTLVTPQISQSFTLSGLDAAGSATLGTGDANQIIVLPPNTLPNGPTEFNQNFFIVDPATAVVTLNGVVLKQIDVPTGSTGDYSWEHTPSDYGGQAQYQKLQLSPLASTQSGLLQNNDVVVVKQNSSIVERATRFRNKRKGPGWFKRFPLASDSDPNISGTYPMSYRMTITERGFFLTMYNEAGVGENDNYAWLCVQRTANNETGLPRTDDSSRYPTHCLYSCSREQLTARDFGVYFSEAAANLQTAANQVGIVYDAAGTAYN